MILKLLHMSICNLLITVNNNHMPMSCLCPPCSQLIQKPDTHTYSPLSLSLSLSLPLSLSLSVSLSLSLCLSLLSIRRETRSQKLTLTHATCIYACTRAHTYTHINTRAHAHIQAHTRTHEHTRAHTHTSTHTQSEDVSHLSPLHQAGGADRRKLRVSG